MQPVADTRPALRASLQPVRRQPFCRRRTRAHAHLKRNERKQREADERKAMLAEREAAVRNARPQTPDTPKSLAFNPADLIAKAMAKAQTNKTASPPPTTAKTISRNR